MSEARREQREAQTDGDYFIEMRFWDAAGEQWGGRGAINPKHAEVSLVEMARSVAFMVTDEETIERFGVTVAPLDDAREQSVPAEV